MRVRSVEAITVDVPLEKPIILGPVRYDTREYLLVRVKSDDGIDGIGFGMTRNAPLAAIVERNIAPLLVGQDPRDTERNWQRLYDANQIIARGGIYMRAHSAVDIALWDLKAKAFGVPLWRLLGGSRRRIPSQVAGVYPADGKTLDDVAAEVRQYAGQRFGFIKLAAGELHEDTARLRAAREAAPDARLIHDVHWGWRDVLEVLPVVRRWREFGLDSLEDPFPSDLFYQIARLGRETGIPLALGEDYAGRWAFRDLLASGVADVIRFDATTMGGVTEAIKVVAMASAYGLPVSPHVFPEVHVHIGAAFENVRAVEMTDPRYGYEVLYKLFSTWVRLDDGEFVAPEAPGLGVEIDWRAVDGFRRR
jgi:L-alanine-DL-glutamate epimerase-like enolase superfamily enzyme